MLKNFPSKDVRKRVKCEVRNNDFFVFDQLGGYEIVNLSAATPKGIADQIASALVEARDIGFEQGLKSVRDVLGIHRHPGGMS